MSEEEFPDSTRFDNKDGVLRPICIVCKSGPSGADRLFMFGGDRQFMTEFEEKMTSMIGQEEFKALCLRHKTKMGRSYICKQCFQLINSTHDTIIKIQRGVHRTVRRLEIEGGNEDNSYDSSSDIQVRRKKLAPLAERIKEKIASIKCVEINNMLPQVVLTSVGEDFHHRMILQTELREDPLMNENLCDPPANGDVQAHSKILEDSETIKILTNPSLLVKSPQPVKLTAVKNNKVYLCAQDGCDWIFSSKYLWDNHIRHYHLYGKPFRCLFEGCRRSFTSHGRLIHHMRSHTRERPFICERCGKSFIDAQVLANHKRTHDTEGKPFQCPRAGCEHKYKYRTSLMRHLRHHDGYFPFRCDHPGCGRAFKNKYELKCHHRRHTGERPIRCKEPGCSKTFTLPCEYTKHRRLAHTGERPFKCTVETCKATFVTKGALCNHTLTHSRRNNFCCEKCGKTFKYKTSYLVHHKTHSSLSHFSCSTEGCDRVFQHQSHLKIHMIQCHEKQPDTND